MNRGRNENGMAYRVSDRVNDLSHSKALVNEREAASGAGFIIVLRTGNGTHKRFFARMRATMRDKCKPRCLH